MYKQTFFSTLLVTAFNILPAFADSCYAVGYTNLNSEGWGPGGTTYAGSQGLTLYNSNDEEIGSYDLCDTCSGVCSDFITVPTSNLSQVFEWGASCGLSGFRYVFPYTDDSGDLGTCANFGRSECHGAYGDQTHIDGEDPQSGTDFYGLGIDATSECRVNFEC